MDVIIIEDEPLIAQALEAGIHAIRPDIHIPKTLGSIKHAIAYFEQAPLPDLFFSDIQLSDGLSFEIFRHLQSKTPVIFCTAYDQYALDAFRANGVDYILKPFDENALKATLEKYSSLKENKETSSAAMNQLMELLSKGAKPQQQETLLAYQGEKIIPIDLGDIAVVSLENELCYLYTFDGSRYMTNRRLESLETKLGTGFFRANRQCIISKKAIVSVSPYFARKLIVQVKVEIEQKVVVSKAKASTFIAWLEGEG